MTKSNKVKKTKTPQDMIKGTIHKTIFCGEVEVVKYLNAHNILVRFKSTGTTKKTGAQPLRLGKIKDLCTPTVAGVGFIGVGPYGSGFLGGWAYRSWQSLIANCYGNGKEVTRAGYYKDWSVHPDWHNFQNFAKWYEGNLPNDGVKYILCRKKNKKKTYSPCTFFFTTHSCATSIKHSNK